MVNLRFRGINLKDSHTFKTIDPYVTVQMLAKGQTQPLGQTEVCRNNQNPEFQGTVPVEYAFQLSQELVFTVADADNNGKPIGAASCMLSKIITTNGPTVLQLSDKATSSPAGSLMILYEKDNRSSRTFTVQIGCTKVKDVEIFSKSDPFLKLFKASNPGSASMNPLQIPDSDWMLVHETEHKKSNLNPTFQEFNIGSMALCQDDPNTPIKFEIWDYNSNKHHTYIGRGFTTVQRIMSGDREIRTTDKKDDFSGSIKILQFQEGKTSDMIDFVQTGLQINEIMAIDFTASNGSPSSKSSLHYHDPSGANNQYQEAIKQVGNIVLEYDTDKTIPVYGFGAQVDGKTTHCFPLDRNNPAVYGVQGVLAAYKKTLDEVTLSGPTNFAPVINNTKSQVQSLINSGRMTYFILMIITDGQISDMEKTKEAIVECSELPMSIIIVGVGDEDFDNMGELDGDEGVLKTNSGKTAKRDIVNFVAFNECKGNSHKLAEEVLQGIPAQINKYFTSMGRPGY